MASAEPKRRPMIEHALEYLRAGLPVFPICSPLMSGHQHRNADTNRMETCTGAGIGKTPLIRWRGYQQQLPEEDDVRFWWKKWPTANIGLATGELSGVLVLDADGTEARKEVMRRGGLENTPTVWTGKIGGAHFHLAYPGGDVRNFARKLPGTDMRAQGGYVLMPPSVHATGNVYRWADGTEHIDHAPVPGWLTELFTVAGDTSDGMFSDGLDIDEVMHGIPQGKRDDTLFRYACKLRHDEVPRADAKELLRQAARACKPAFDEATAAGKVDRVYDNPEYDPPGSPTVEADEFFAPPSGGVHVDGLEENASPEAASASFLRPISELLALPEVEPDWMVDQLFTVGSNGWVAAEPKVGKSWIVLELVYALTTGMPFLGRFAVKQPRRVIYIQEEDSEQRVARRFRKLLRGTPERGLPTDEYLRWSVRVGFKIDSQAWVNRLREELIAFPAEVVVLDVFNRLHSLEENKQADMTRVLNTLMDFNRIFGCAFIVVHHNRKPQAGSEARANQMIRGSGVLAGWGECSLYLRRDKQKDTIIVTPESKDAPEMDDFVVKLTDIDEQSVVLELGEIEAKESISVADAETIRAVQEITDQGIGATAKAVAEALRRDRSTVQTRLTRLVSAGYLIANAISDAPSATKIYTVAVS
jgi:hypothetical protein